MISNGRPKNGHMYLNTSHGMGDSTVTLLTYHEGQRLIHYYGGTSMIPQEVAFYSPRQRGGPYIITRNEADIARYCYYLTPLVKISNYKGSSRN